MAVCVDDPDSTDIDPRGGWTRTSIRMRPVVPDELLPIQVPDTFLAEVAFQGGERRVHARFFGLT